MPPGSPRCPVAGKKHNKTFIPPHLQVAGSPVGWPRLACTRAPPWGIILGTTAWITRAEGSRQDPQLAPEWGKRDKGAGEHQLQEKATVEERRRKSGEARGGPSARLEQLGCAGGCQPFLSLGPRVRRGPVHPPGRGKLKPALPTRAKRDRNEDSGTKKQRAGGLG